MLSAAASLGTILLWDVDGGLTQIDKYLYSSEDYIKVGGTSPGLGSMAAHGSPAVGWVCSRLGEWHLALVCCMAQLLPREGQISCVLGFWWLTAKQGALGDCLRPLWGPVVTEL